MASNGPCDVPTSASGAPPAKAPSEKELARKIRKRELDRRAQRQARERTRNRITELEAQVKELRKDDSTRLSACMEQLAAVTRERDRLVDTFKSVEQTIRDNILPSRPGPASRQSSAVTTVASLPDPQDALITGLPVSSYAAPIGMHPNETLSAANSHAFHINVAADAVPNGFPAPSVYALSAHAPSSSSESAEFVEALDDDEQDGPDDPNVIVPPPETPCECITVRSPANPGSPRVNVWRAVNEVLAKRCVISQEAHMIEDASEEDIPVRVLLEGWDAVAKSRPLSKLWKKLRRVDELCFNKCSETERLAILRIMHLLLQYHSDPTPARQAKLPTWLLKRPSQAMPHSYAIDFFVWPGVRERFVFGQHHYCNNDFWKLFGPNLHILWPFEFRDTYRKSLVTGQYQLSPSFAERMSDINAWTMGMDFFTRFPELIADIPAFQSLSQPLMPMATPSSMPRQASLSRLKERDEKLLLDQSSDEPPTQDLVDCSQTMQIYPDAMYTMANPPFMNDFIPQSYDADGNTTHYVPLNGYY
ncbi:hypothetical protein EsH8_VI_000358 [Colletotrichum jinshuiense]